MFRLAIFCIVWNAAAQTTLLEEANAHYRALRSEDAVRTYREYLSRNPDRADVRVFLGGALLNLDRWQEAAAEGAAALRLDPEYGKAYVLLGRIGIARQDWSAAERYFSRAMALHPEDRETWYFAGRAAYEENHFDSAIERFERALALGATESRVYENLGLALEAAARFQDAEKAYRKALDRAEGAWRPYLAYGRFLFKQGRTKDSLEPLAEAFRLQPADADVKFEFGRALYKGEDIERAITVLTSTPATDDCRVHNLLVKIFSLKGDLRRSAKELSGLERCAEGRLF